MLSAQDSLHANEQQVAAKVVDNEAILINLSNGMYYSMGGVGALIWSLIVKRHTLSDITKTICSQYDVLNEKAFDDLQTLATELLKEDLVTLSQDGVASTDANLKDEQQSKLPYEAPNLSKYDDMADMFALDPPLPGLADVSSNDLPERSDK